MSEHISRVLSTGGGIFTHVDALAAPLNLFFVQATIIICMCRFLSIFGYYLNQPRVIFEIIGGILLGPSALGRDGYYIHTIFPSSSLPYLSIIANIGLTFYLFLVGLELDLQLLATHGKKAGVIAIVGMAIPFVLGIAISQTMLDNLQPGSDVSFVSFFVFIGTAMSITAFPVLARIMKEGGLIYTKAGAMTMGAAALNDAIAWCLLALAISIANAGDMKTSGYIFASIVAITVTLLFVIGPIYRQLVEYVESLDSPAMNSNLFALTICFLFICAWTTALIGLDSIFGAFLFGLVIPRDSHLFKECNERIEEFVLTFTLPLYFTLSGLNTDITSITTGNQGAMIVLVCFCATIGKFVGAGGAAYFCGMSMRESAVVAALMNTRGLVELIVLNAGLQAGILNTQTFSVMVIMCLFTTFITNPLVSWLYPEHMRSGEAKPVENAIGEQAAGIEDGQPIVLSKEINLQQCKHIGIVVDSMSQMQHWINMIPYFMPNNMKSEFAITVMHFLEPTKTYKDELLGLNAEGRLIRVDEETTDYLTALALAHDPLAKKAEMLPISMFCKALKIAVNAFRIEGDPVEFPWELKSLAKQNDCSLLCIPWRGTSAYAQKFFWSSLHILNTSASIALVVNMKPHAAATDGAHYHHPEEVIASPPSGRRPSVFSRLDSYRPAETTEMELPTVHSPDQPMYSNVQATTLPRNRRNSITSVIQKVDPTHRSLINIVAILTGQHTDLIILGMLLRYAENPLHAITIHLPQDHEAFSDIHVHALKQFRKESYVENNLNIEFIDCASISTDYDGLVNEVTCIAFDIVLCSFILPVAAWEEPAVNGSEHNNNAAPATPIGRGRANTLSETVAEAFTSTRTNNNASNNVADLYLQQERMHFGMPAQCAFSPLLYPELGTVGSKLMSGKIEKASLLFVVHDPLKATAPRSSIVSDFTAVQSATDSIPL